MHSLSPTARLLLAAVAALVSAQADREGDDARDALLDGLARELRALDVAGPEHLFRELIDAAVWESSPEQLPNARALQAAARSLAAFDSDPANQRDPRFVMFEDEDEDPNEAIRREYEADLLSPLDRERMDPRSYE